MKSLNVLLRQSIILVHVHILVYSTLKDEQILKCTDLTPAEPLVIARLGLKGRDGPIYITYHSLQQRNNFGGSVNEDRRKYLRL